MSQNEPLDEQLQLQIERANARSRMKETWKTISKLKDILSVYEADYMRWHKRYINADLTLAEQDGRLKKLKDHQQTPEKTPKDIALILTKEQIEEIAKRVGISIEFRKEESDGSET